MRKTLQVTSHHNVRCSSCDWGPKTVDLVLTTSQLNGKFKGQCLWRGTWYRQLENGVGNYGGSPTSSQNFV